MNKPNYAVRVFYRNHRGEESWRRIQPRRIYFGANQYHPTPQWILEAIDLDKNQSRNMAMADIKEWVPDDGSGPWLPPRSEGL